MSLEKSVEEIVARDLHNLLYLEEFVFPKSTFSPPGQSEVELADAVVALDDTLLLLQIKERSPANTGDAEAERTWFQRKVLKEGSRQIRATLAYLDSLEDIHIHNGRGRTFNLASNRYGSLVKIIIYRGGKSLPGDCGNVRFYRSQTAGFIHVIEFSDYVRLSEILRVPEEIILYLRYREDVLTRFYEESGTLPEASLVGAFIGNDDGIPPTYESYRHLHNLVDDEETWNIVPLLRGLHDHQSRADFSDDYYHILNEFMRLPRSMWREVKGRIQLAIEKATKDESTWPYRVCFPGRDIGVMIMPVTSGDTSRSDWDKLKVDMLITFTELHKFDQKLGKCIGILVAKIGEMFDIQWCMIDGPWSDNPALRAKLDAESPFRAVSEKTMFGFYTVD